MAVTGFLHSTSSMRKPHGSSELIVKLSLPQNGRNYATKFGSSAVLLYVQKP